MSKSFVSTRNLSIITKLRAMFIVTLALLSIKYSAIRFFPNKHKHDVVWQPNPCSSENIYLSAGHTTTRSLNKQNSFRYEHISQHLKEIRFPIVECNNISKLKTQESEFSRFYVRTENNKVNRI